MNIESKSKLRKLSVAILLLLTYVLSGKRTFFIFVSTTVMTWIFLHVENVVFLLYTFIVVFVMLMIFFVFIYNKQHSDL